jgi:glycosyltransferase involved in cell wall biosynthesis
MLPYLIKALCLIEKTSNGDDPIGIGILGLWSRDKGDQSDDSCRTKITCHKTAQTEERRKRFDSRGTSMPKVELISNISHYYHTALSLYRSGYLGDYITGPSALDNEAWIRRLGKSFERLWIERRLEGIPPHLVKRLWLPEIVQKAVKRFGGTAEQSIWAHNELFAREAAWIMADCDVVHFVQSVGLEAARKAKRSGAKVICDMREEHPHFVEQILSEEATRLKIEFTFDGRGSSYIHRVIEELDLADYIFCPSSYARRTFVEQGISEDKLVVCPYGVDSKAFIPRERSRASEQFSILFLGNISMRKGVHYLLEAYQKAGLKNARLLLAGPVDPAFRRVLRQYEGLFEEVGRIPHSQVHEHYQKADVFVIPSLADTYGLVVLEAMSAGLPVIVSENTGTADIVKNGREGFVVPIRNTQEIAEKLTFLYENREHCVEMGMAASLAVRVLGWDNYETVCADFYKSLFRDDALKARPNDSL